MKLNKKKKCNNKINMERASISTVSTYKENDLLRILEYHEDSKKNIFEFKDFSNNDFESNNSICSQLSLNENLDFKEKFKLKLKTKIKRNTSKLLEEIDLSSNNLIHNLNINEFNSYTTLLNSVMEYKFSDLLDKIKEKRSNTFIKIQNTY